MFPIDRLELIAQLRGALEGVMTVEGYHFDEDGTIKLRGRLKVAPDAAYAPIRDGMRKIGFTPYLRDAKDGHEVTAVPGVIPKAKDNPQLAAALFAATVISVVFTGSLLNGEFNLLDGLMFAGTLLSILVAHEMGHYVVAKRLGAQVSLPYFIPLPAPIGLGTMGAVILQREPFENRRSLLQIAAAGPIAGFIVALPLFILGVALSAAARAVTEPLEGALGDSLMTYVIGTFRYGTAWTSPTELIQVHPIGFGAWLGLLITGINLMPAGQLDGGHIMYALLGEQAKYVTWTVIAALIILSFVSQAWILWVGLLFFFGRTHPPPLNEAVKLKAIHYLLIVIAALVFVITFVPKPLA
jgi:membrane-associated protease RseP (regulator of RpoE activity)